MQPSFRHKNPHISPVFTVVYKRTIGLKIRVSAVQGWAKNRRGRDSNPRYGLYPYDGLANRYLQPLGHLSKFFIDRQLRKKPYDPLFSDTTIPTTLHPAGQYCKKIKSCPYYSTIPSCQLYTCDIKVSCGRGFVKSAYRRRVR